jgi:hypothetical protein
MVRSHANFSRLDHRQQADDQETERLVFTHKPSPPCLLVRQVDQFEGLEETDEYRAKTPAALRGR